MNCLTCRGACCESFALPLVDIRPPSRDALRWVALHGDTEDGWIRFDCRCTALNRGGLCAIYDTRPDVCRDYEPGCPDCYDAVRRRRTPDQYAEIREEGDPEPEVLYGTE